MAGKEPTLEDMLKVIEEFGISHTTLEKLDLSEEEIKSLYLKIKSVNSGIIN